MSYLTQDFFKSNREKIKKITESDVIVVAANCAVQKSHDVSYKFSQDSNFYYLTGINKPGYVLVIDKAKDSEYLISPAQSNYTRAFYGANDQSELALRSGITEILANEEGWLKLQSRLAQTKKAATLSPPDAFIETYAMFTNPSRRSIIDKISSKDDVEFEFINEKVAETRQIKEQVEIDAIKKAVDHTVDALNFVKDNFKSYKYEYEIEADLLKFVRGHGLGDVSYEPIVASGVNASLPHYEDNNAKLDADKVLLIDFGAQVEGYTADITRMFMPSNRQAQKVFDQVLDIQKKALEFIGPGVNFIDYEKEVRQMYVPAMQELGLIKDDDIESTTEYAPTATSHFLGLDVHDVGSFKTEFKPGMVITVEPGIYVPKWDLGVRIEDDVLITDSGIEVLSSGLPASL